MLRKLVFCLVLAGTLTTISGCIIHDPGYYPPSRTYYYDPYPYYYAPYYYTPFWFSGSFFFGDFDRGHDFRGHKHSRGHGGGHGGRR